MLGARHTSARGRTRAPGFLATGAMPLNRKRPPVTIQVPEVPRAVYELSESGTFTEGNLEISRSGMRIAGARSSAGGVATADGAPGAGPPGEAAAPRKSPRGIGDGSSGKATEVGAGARGADGDGAKGGAPETEADGVVGDSDDAAARRETNAATDHRPTDRPTDANETPSAQVVSRDTCHVPRATANANASRDETSAPFDKRDASGGERFDFDVSLDELAVVGACGKGAGGVVQKAVHVPTGTFLAVKIVQMNVQPEIRKRIIGELRALHDARCPYVVAYRGAFFGDGSVSIVLEYADGGSVADVTSRLGFIEEPALREIARQTLLGLEYLHVTKKIVHRDVKPSNILVNTDGSAKISDFGVSGHLADSVAKCDSWVGTVTYMSPERISGEAYAFDSDVWSLGLALLECATGRFPYPPETSDDGDVSYGYLVSKNSETAPPRAPPKTLGFWDLLDHIVREPAPTLPRTLSRASLAKRAFVAKKKAGDARKKTNEDDAEESGDAPTIVAFSRAFREVTELCLQKRPERRAGASALLASAWLAGADAERGRAILAETVRSANQRA